MDFSGNGYAWQDAEFLAGSHWLRIACARWNMRKVGMTMCGYTSEQFPCILWHYWRQDTEAADPDVKCINCGKPYRPGGQWTVFGNWFCPACVD